MSVDRRALKVLLAGLEMEQRELAERMSYDTTYVANILNGFTEPSDAFKAAFGEVIADAVLGCSRRRKILYPAEPLRQLIRKRAAEAGSKELFYADLGLSCNGWKNRRNVTADTVDRVCCALGVHPSSLYGHDFEVAS